MSTAVRCIQTYRHTGIHEPRTFARIGSSVRHLVSSSANADGPRGIWSALVARLPPPTPAPPPPPPPPPLLLLLLLAALAVLRLPPCTSSRPAPLLVMAVAVVVVRPLCVRVGGRGCTLPALAGLHADVDDGGGGACDACACVALPSAAVSMCVFREGGRGIMRRWELCFAAGMSGSLSSSPPASLPVGSRLQKMRVSE